MRTSVEWCNAWRLQNTLLSDSVIAVIASFVHLEGDATAASIHTGLDIYVSAGTESTYWVANWVACFVCTCTTGRQFAETQDYEDIVRQHYDTKRLSPEYMTTCSDAGVSCIYIYI